MPPKADVPAKYAKGLLLTLSGLAEELNKSATECFDQLFLLRTQPRLRTLGKLIGLQNCAKIKFGITSASSKIYWGYYYA